MKRYAFGTAMGLVRLVGILDGIREYWTRDFHCYSYGVAVGAMRGNGRDVSDWSGVGDHPLDRAAYRQGIDDGRAQATGVRA